MTNSELSGEQKKLAKKIAMARDELKLAQEWLDSLVHSCNHLPVEDGGAIVCAVCKTTLKGADDEGS